MRFIAALVVLVGCSSSPSTRPLVDEACLPAGEAPQTIADAVERINALPKPVTLPCFLASLPRPLDIVATESIFSAQPSLDRDHPRMFLFTGGLVMSIVLGGDGGHLLEFGEWTSDTRSIKGEIPFPVTTELDGSAPYEILFEDRELTTCAFCHAAEDPVEGLDGAFVSDALRPRQRDLVSLERMEAVHEFCDPEVEPEVCLMLHALFDFGEVRETRFDLRIATF
ncbi:MAG: hypothetical protein AAGE52_13435 [Myxococcota bacterium]